MSPSPIATAILGLAEIGFITWIGCKHATWWKRVLIPSLRDAWRRPLADHLADGRMAIQEVRSINSALSQRLLHTGPRFMRRFWTWFLNLSEDNQRALGIAIIAVAGVGAEAVVDGLQGFVIGLVCFLVTLLGISILMPLVARRERDELTRRNKDKRERSRKADDTDETDSTDEVDDDPES